MIDKSFKLIHRRPAPGAPRLVGRFCRDSGGAMAIMMALLLPMMVGMMGLTVDVGVWYAEKRGLQNIADAAALAGGSALVNGASTAGVVIAATADANRNELDALKDALTVNIPPFSGPNAGNDGSVEVIIIREMPLFFTTAFFNLIGATTQQFNATARAVVNTAFVDEFCILSLDPTESKAVNVFGNGTATLDCGIAVNSDASNALSVSGNATLTTSSVTTVGQTSISGGAVLASNNPPRRGGSVGDPYGDLVIPDFGNCDDSGGAFPDAQSNGGVFVVCEGLPKDKIVNLTAGVYIFDQVDFKINAGQSVIGDGVTIILTSSGADNKIGKVRVNGGADIQLSAPTTDPPGAPGFSGVLFFQDRNVSTNKSKSNLFAGGAELKLEGALYFPSQELKFVGGSEIGDGCTQLVAKKVSIGGDTGLQTNCNNSGTRAIGRLKATLGE